MASSSTPSSSSHLIPRSSSKSWSYEVFLSFRGEDTRKTFVDHLYTSLVQHGIHTYKDDETLPRGESVGPSLLKAIRESRIAVTVFSENYADSSWCLDELAYIMECMTTRGQIVMPVFYNVNPSDVRKQKGKYGEAFAKHELENNHKAESWKNALAAAGNLSGWVTKDFANGHEAKCIKDIVGSISSKLYPLISKDSKDLIGIETRLQDLKSKLETGPSGGVRIVGIWGVGGGGKTTLASAAYTEMSVDFEGHCFLENIREESSKHGLKMLQKNMLLSVLKTEVAVQSVEEGRSIIERRLCHKKVLVVLDDVDDLKQLEALVGSRDWFGEGSRIIITTRNEHVFRKADSGVGNFGAMTAMASAYMHPAGNFGVVTPPMTNNLTVTTMQPGITQPVHCEVCNITCDTADVLEIHKLGKKHLKNVQKQAITSVIAQNTPSLTPASAPSDGKLEDKWHRILQNGASVDTLLHCDLCNVVCNNEISFQDHVASKKHVAKAIMRQAGTGETGTGEVGTGETGTGEAGTGEAGTGGGGGLLTPTSEGDCNPQPLSSDVFKCELCKISCTSKQLLDLHISGKKHQKKVKDSVQVPDPVGGTTIISNEVKAISCEICGISCNTYEVFKIHLTGRKHLKNLEKSQQPSVPHNPVPTSEPVSTPEVVEPVSTSKVVEPVSTPKVVEPVSAPKVVEPVSALNVVEPPVLTPKVVEPVSTPKVVEPVSTPKVVEPVSTPKVVEPVSTPKVVEPVSTPKVVEVLQDSLKKEDKIVVSHEVKPTCEICGISCDTNEMLNIHFTGRKHQKNLKKLEKPSVPHKPVPTTDDGGEIATTMVVDQLQDSLKDDKIVNEDGSVRKGKRVGSQIDLETKKQKIMQGGTASASLRACTVCNVVCNSPKMFDNHMAGQKHLAMVAKQAKAQ